MPATCSLKSKAFDSRACARVNAACKDHRKIKRPFEKIFCRQDRLSTAWHHARLTRFERFTQCPSTSVGCRCDVDGSETQDDQTWPTRPAQCTVRELVRVVGRQDAGLSVRVSRVADQSVGLSGGTVCPLARIGATASPCGTREIGGRRLEGSTVDDLGRGLDVPPVFTSLPRMAVAECVWHSAGKALHGLFPRCRPVAKPRFVTVGERRIHGRQECSAARVRSRRCLPRGGCPAVESGVSAVAWGSPWHDASSDADRILGSVENSSTWPSISCGSCRGSSFWP